MLELLNKKYDELKIYIKYNKNHIYDEELNDVIVSFYTAVLGYYAAKIDLGINTDVTEKLKDKIMLESFDKKLIDKLDLNEYMNYFININSESKRASIYDSIHFLKITKNVDSEILKNIKTDFDDAYLKTAINKNQNKLNIKNQNKIGKIYIKSCKLIDKDKK